MKSTIKAFIDTKSLAIAGVSRDSMKWGNVIFRAITKKGYTVFPVNPAADTINGKTCYKSVSDLPDNVENIIIAIPGSKIMPVLEECKKSGIKRIWLHQGSGSGAYNDEAKEFCKDKNLELVYGFCPMMFFPNAGAHKIHLFFKKLFGAVPPEYKSA
jgi:uncharacterized protein